MTPHAAAIHTILWTAPLAAFLQAGTSPDIGWINQVERLGLVSALTIAVSVLWRTGRAAVDKKDMQLDVKDEQLVQMTKHVTEAMLSQAETLREVRRVLEESQQTKERLRESIHALGGSISQLRCLREFNKP